jgi:cytochrome b6-f complex iron-sulfur subunit
LCCKSVFYKFNNPEIMNRKEFFAKVGFGAAAVLLPGCIAGLTTSCSKDEGGANAPTNVDFTLDTSTGALATNVGFLVSNGVVVARTNEGQFLAVSASCPHKGTNVNYVKESNSFHCPNHGQNFSSTGAVTTGGQTSTNLKQYNTTLTGTSLRVFS